MLPLLLRQDGKKGGKKECFCHRIWHASTARPRHRFCCAGMCSRGIIPIPKSKTPARLAENIAVFDFAPEGENMAALGGMHQNRRTSHDPLTFDFGSS